MLNLFIYAAIGVLMLSALAPRNRSVIASLCRREVPAPTAPPAGTMIGPTDAAQLLGYAHAGGSFEGLLISAGVRAHITEDGYLRFDANDVLALGAGDLPLRPTTNRT